MARVIIAGIVGGLLVFFAGFVDHMVFGWSGRTFGRLTDEAAVRQFFTERPLSPGIYGFPEMAEGVAEFPAEQQQQEWDRVGKLYENGPAGYIIMAPTGEEMMGPKKLGSEAATNVGAALLFAWIAAQARGSNVLQRWLMIVVAALAGWVSLVASFNIWYRFPASFVMDELWCQLFEWAVAGVAMAAIVRPEPASAPPNP